jgi:hypothetical protein
MSCGGERTGNSIPGACRRGTDGKQAQSLIDRRHPRDLHDAFRFLSSGADYDRELLRKLAVLFASTLDRDLREYRSERYENIEQGCTT